MPQSRAYILVADDDAEDRVIMGSCFEEIGYSGKINFVEDGLQLLEYMEDMQEVVSLIILDLNMPRLNGTETLRRLKGSTRYQHIPVIIFSTSVNEIEKKICMGLGAREYVTKPSKWDEYLEVCKRLQDISFEQLPAS